jgi:ABC-type polysaccharide/polyol phosphate transport system ATPase subunit
LIDEVLAVGDADFQRQCVERIEHLRGQGVTIVFVSHDLQTVEQICDRAAYLESGRLLALGSAQTVVERYRKDVTWTAVRPKNASSG